MGLSRQTVSLFSKNYRDVKALYLAAFPAVERFPYLPLVLNTQRRLANFYAYYDDEKFVGLAYLLENKEVIHLIFLAVNTKIRSRGYGTAILKDIKQLAGNRPVVLEIEPMDKTAENYDQRVKRLAFYEKNGFRVTDYYYHEGKEVYQVMTTDDAFDIRSVERLTKKAVLGLISISFEKN